MHTLSARPAENHPVETDVLSLCARIREGDADAFETLYRVWFERVYAMARAVSRRDESFCLDAAQEVMLRAARSLPALNGEAELCGWFSKVTLSVCIDQTRRESRRARREAAAAHRPETPRGPDADELAWIASRIAELPTPEYELVLARLAHDRTLRESGLATGISEHSANGRVRRVLQRLNAAARRMWP